MFGISTRIRRKGNGGFGGAGHGAVMTMLSWNIQKCRNDDIRPFLPIGAYQPLDDALFVPPGKCGVAILGKTEIMHRVFRPVSEPMDIGIELPCSLLQFTRSQDAKRPQPFWPERILPALATGRAGDHNPHSEAKAEHCQQTVLLVIRMSPGVHDSRGRFQSGQRMVQPDQGRPGLLSFNPLMGCQHSILLPIITCCGLCLLVMYRVWGSRLRRAAGLRHRGRRSIDPSGRAERAEGSAHGGSRQTLADDAWRK